MIVIDGRIFAQIQIDGKDIPPTPDFVGRILMTEGNSALSPALEMYLNDSAGHLGRDLALTDGNQVLVTLGRTADSTQTVTRQYRLFGHRQLDPAKGAVIKAVAILDAPDYLTSSTIETYRGTSSQALLEIATRSKMCYSGPEDFNGRATADKQRWRAVSQSRASAAWDICRHGYLDDHSAMALVTTSLGCLKYRNLIDVIDTPLEKIRTAFVHNALAGSKDSSKEIYVVHQARDSSVAGLMNSWQNYGSTRYEHRLDGVQAEHSSVDVKTSGDFLAINSQVSATVSRARRDYGPLDCGNTHPNYERALYQNVKQLALFSERMSLLVLDVTDVQLLDPVIYRQANADLKEPVKNSDIYIVVGKSVMLNGGKTYAERIEIARMSLTTKGSSILKCAEPAKDAASAIPSVTINPTVTTANSTLSAVKSASSMVAQARQSLNNVRSTVRGIADAVATTTLQARSTVAALKNIRNNPDAALAALQTSLPGVETLVATLTTVRGHLAVAASEVSEVQQLAVETSVTANMMGSVLGMKGGAIESFGTSMGGIKQVSDSLRVQQSISAEVWTNREQLTARPGGTEVVAAYRTAVRNLENVSKNVLGDSTAVWNSCVGALKVIPVPSVVEGRAFETTLARAWTPNDYSATGVLSPPEFSTNVQRAMTSNKSPWQGPIVLAGTPPKITELDVLLDTLDADAKKAELRYRLPETFA